MRHPKSKPARSTMLRKPRPTADRTARSKGRPKAATLPIVSRDERELRAELKAALENAGAVLEQQIRVLRALEMRWYGRN